MGNDSDMEDGNDSEEDLMEIVKQGGIKVSDDKPKQEQTIQLKKRIPIVPRPNPAALKSPLVIGLSPASGYSPAIESQSEKYASRGKAGDVIFRYKCKDSGAWEKERSHNTNWEIKTLNSTTELVNNDFKYMFQKTGEMARAMDYTTQTLGQGIFEELKKEASTPESKDEILNSRGSLTELSGDEACYIGRIRSGGDGKLTPGSVYFEGCLQDSDGSILNMDLSAVEEYHIFPGQALVAEGKNEMGKILRVKSLLTPSLPSFHTFQIENKLDPLNILIAAGPFTPSDSIKYEPLNDLISIIKKEVPDVVFLIGPFIDSRHKMVEDIGVPFDDFFAAQIEYLKKELTDCSTTILIVPNHRDVHAEAVYPTPPYSFKSSLKLKVLCDPATVSIGDITIGVTSNDIMMHLSRNELANSTITGDRMGRFARHLLTQRSYYPLYPPDESIPLDVEHNVKFGLMSVRPHILITPSDLRHFIKDVEGTIVINPERLTKGCSGGIYARIQVDLSNVPKNKQLDSVADFCVGEIIKI